LLQTGTKKTDLPERFKSRLADIHNNLVKTYGLIGERKSNEKPNLKEMREILAFHEKCLRAARAVISVDEVTNFLSCFSLRSHL